MRHGRRWLVGVVVAVSLSACDGFSLLGPEDARSGKGELVAGGVRVTLTVTPSDVTRPGSALAVLRYRNETAAPVVVTSGAGCLAFAGVYQGQKRISFPSTDYYCTAAITYHELEPGGTLGMEWPLKIGGAGVALSPGYYRFVAHLNTHGRDLERTFRVH